MRLKSIKQDAIKGLEALRQVRRLALPIVGIFAIRKADLQTKIADLRVLCKQIIAQVNKIFHDYDWCESSSLDVSQEF